ncbi:hypothetical protein JCM17844_16870 [Iodidimonas gelatinilytica]|uniref:Uncharacterized protein n=1 Tax=Iodidimonas gelatinilytica TaxID=1236966 RepID=A0A5A7MPU3_9PROT|nr:hypothetical protein JCM17844_16870 [Iodidimonas gelatinilytica]
MVPCEADMGMRLIEHKSFRCGFKRRCQSKAQSKARGGAQKECLHSYHVKPHFVSRAG